MAIILGAWGSSLYEAHTPVKRSTLHLEMTPDMVRMNTQRLYAGDEIQWKCLDALWTMESHWNYKAKGATTSRGRALGIAQALPDTKMKSMGLDYKSNPMTQVKWGLKYIRTRYYNKACIALRHELDRGWY